MKYTYDGSSLNKPAAPAVPRAVQPVGCLVKPFGCLFSWKFLAALALALFALVAVCRLAWNTLKPSNAPAPTATETTSDARS